MHMKNIGVTPTIVQTLPTETLKCVFCAAREELDAFRAWFTAQFGARYEMNYSHHSLLELQAAGANKGAQIAWLAQTLGADRVFAAGDGENDLSMAQRYPLYAPANAVPALKAAAVAVGPRCDENFVAWVLQRPEAR
jgi:hydroxymethylpyrimidine pyrophosphatase-like HAD family hydrolase